MAASEIFLLDSSVIIAANRSSPRRAIAKRYREIIERGQAAINRVIHFEFAIGSRNDQERRINDDLLRGLTALTIDDETWDIAIDLAWRLRRAGMAQPLADVTIAATAIRHKVTLVHADSDFETIAQYSDLRTESYVDAG